MSHISRASCNFLFIAFVASSLIVGCGRRPEGSAQPAQPSESSFKDAGSYELHFNAVRTDMVKPDVARTYGIERSKNRVMLNVTVLRKDADNIARKAVEAIVAVSARNLNGQQKSMEIRRVNEGDAIYYIGETGISGSEILVFDISATPNNESTPITAQLRREFFSD